MKKLILLVAAMLVIASNISAAEKINWGTCCNYGDDGKLTSELWYNLANPASVDINCKVGNTFLRHSNDDLTPPVQHTVIKVQHYPSYRICAPTIDQIDTFVSPITEKPVDEFIYSKPTLPGQIEASTVNPPSQETTTSTIAYNTSEPEVNTIVKKELEPVVVAAAPAPVVTVEPVVMTREQLLVKINEILKMLEIMKAQLAAMQG